MRKVQVLWAVLLLSACGTAPVFTPPEMELPDSYQRLAPVSKASAEDLRWWQHFNDPLMDRLVDAALAENLSLAQARARLAEAEALARRDGVLLDGDADLTTTGSSISSASDTTLGVGMRVNLAGEKRRRAEGAARRLEAARFGTVEARRTVLAELGIAYADLRFAQASLAAREQDLASRQRTVTDVQRLLDAGEATRLDVLRAQSLVSETRAQIPVLQADVVRQRNRISTLLGVPVGSLPLDLGYRGQQPAPSMRIAESVPADLLRARPDIRRAERLYAAAISDLGAAEAARYPSLSLRGDITFPHNGGAVSESLIGGLIVPLFDQPALAAAVDAAEAKVRQAYLDWRSLVLAAVEEVENAQAGLQASIAAQHEALKLVGINSQALSLSRDLLTKRGQITVLDVLDRERALADARLQQARTLRDVAVDYIVLQAVLGQGHEAGAD
ncbi:efflux transporter outer membrane subunit [Rhodosalinus sp. 5P4]|uniref:efflux transporter outer membrane subunit n=1 Tax=Rhodosalinus sp. 5P4 TaxID=3239196 RepID=UPI00352334D1